MADKGAAFVLDEQGQEELLQEALRSARDHAFRMKRAMDAGELGNVLKHAAEVLRELRTSLLSPKNYYQLYMQVLDELRHLEAYVEDLAQSPGTPAAASTSIRALYERVQSSGNVLPRLYLLVTVGAVFIKSKEAPAREVLTDLVEMAKGVQHPLRGLFLRNYLSIAVKDRLPDAGSPYESAAGGTTEDAIAFLLHNFRETNRLWIRMQQYPKLSMTAGNKDKTKREKERQDLRLLVGTSLVRLSQLEGVTADVYATHVLPQLLETIVGCKDRLAQEYLLDCIIQVFPDDFHLKNLTALLVAIGELHETANCPVILVTLLERLIKFNGEAGDTTQLNGEDSSTVAGKQKDVLDNLMDSVRKTTEDASRQPHQKPGDILTLFETLVTFTFLKAESKPQNLKRVTSMALERLKPLMVGAEATAPELNLQLKRMILKVLEGVSLEQLRSVDAVHELMKLLPWKSTRKYLVLEWIGSLSKRNDVAKTVEEVEMLMALLAPLVRDDPNDLGTMSEPLKGSVKDDFESEQLQLSKTIHMFQSSNLDVKFQMFSVARRTFGQGGVYRIRFTLVPLVFEALRLARELETRKGEFKTTPREALQFVHEMVTALASKIEQMSVTCVNLFLQCALVADGCQFEAISYEFTTQAFIVYEDQITNSREQWNALELMVSSVCATKNLSSANYEVLATKTTQYAAKLLKKTDQALMVLKCAHLFWHPCHKDGKRVLECLKRSLRIVDACGGGSSNGGASPSLTQVPLFLDVLESYLYFFEAKTPEVTPSYLTGLLALVKEHLENMERGATRGECEVRYRDIRRYMESKSISLT